MPTVRLRDASEYPEETQKLFESVKEWFKYDFAQPPAMTRVMGWDPEFGGPHCGSCSEQHPCGGRSGGSSASSGIC